MKDYYYILGLKIDADSKSIKSAYRKLSLKFHPDKNDSDKFFEERFKEIQEAYNCLSNPIQKLKYDNVLKANQTESRKTNRFYEKEEELRRKEEELRKREDELRKKYQTPEQRKKDYEAEQAKKEAEAKAKLQRELFRLENELKSKQDEIEKINKIRNRLLSETEILGRKISKLKSHNGRGKNNYQGKVNKENFSLSNFPKLRSDLMLIRDFVSSYDYQYFRKIFIQFAKYHKIDSIFIEKHKNLVEIITKRKIPMQETERLFRMYKDNQSFITDLEKEIIQTLK